MQHIFNIRPYRDENSFMIEDSVDGKLGSYIGGVKAYENNYAI
jgi:hypothetical protein